jgi:Lysyl oxidase/Bacterial pre-peptidase C-terminal domain
MTHYFHPRPKQKITQVRLGLESLESRETPAVSQLPDLIVLADASQGYLYDWYLDSNSMPGRTLLRLSNATGNIGSGPLEIRGGSVIGADRQQVFQRVYDTDGGYTDLQAGTFIYHAEHGHVHFEDFLQYNLRRVTPIDGVGEIVSSGVKTSFCLEDTAARFQTLPGFSSNRGYFGCGQVQGISVGWADVYRRNLEGQWIDVTGTPAGEYWLESVADPSNLIQESDETNNTTRIKINLGGDTAPDYAGNTLATASDLGVLTGTQTRQDFVSLTDTNDYYRFSVSTSGNITIRMDNLQADADLELLSINGKVLSRSILSGNQAESITRNLTAGTYYVRVFPYNGANTPYTLTLAGGSVAADGAGNTLGTARDIGEVNGSQTFRDLVSGSDTNDYYRFRVTGQEGSIVSIRLERFSGSAVVQLLNEAGDIIQESTGSGGSTQAIELELHSGEAYYLRVYSPTATTSDYSLVVTGTPMVAPDLAGNTLATARELGTLTNITLQDTVNSTDTNDYYRFTVGRQGRINLMLDGLNADADVQLLDSRGRVIASSTNGGTLSENISRTLQAGTYFVRIFPYRTAITSYRLNLSFL